MHGHDRSRRKHRTLHTLLSAMLDEPTDVVEYKVNSEKPSSEPLTTWRETV